MASASVSSSQAKASAAARSGSFSNSKSAATTNRSTTSASKTSANTSTGTAAKSALSAAGISVPSGATNVTYQPKTTTTAANQSIIGDTYATDASRAAASGNLYARNTALAGRTVSVGNMNITYDADGYAVSGSNTAHPLNAGTDRSILAPSKESVLANLNGMTSERSSFGGSQYDQLYMTSQELQQAAYFREQAAAGKMSWEHANELVNSIRSKYGYTGGSDGSQYNAGSYTLWNPDGMDMEQKTQVYDPYGALRGLSTGGNATAAATGLYGSTGLYGTGTAKTSLPSSGLYGSYGSGYSSDGGPTDYSEYLRQMSDAYLQQQQLALQNAYNQNLSELQSEQGKLAAQYQSARNSESADYALARQRFNETAAANGLNTGSIGQAALSFSNQELSGLSSLHQAETEANQEIERQRTLLGQEYQNQMAQALAQNNYQLYQSLYQEAVRADEALQQQQQYQSSLALQQAQLALQQQQQAWNQQQSALEWEYQQQQDAWKQQYTADSDAQETALASAKLLAAAGDYSAYGKIYGWDDATVQKMNRLWAAANTGGSGSGRSYSGGSGGGTGGETAAGLYSDAWAWARTYGNSGSYESDVENYIRNNYKSGGFSSQAAAIRGYEQYIKENQSTAYEGKEYSSIRQQALMMRNQGKTDGEIATWLGSRSTDKLTDTGMRMILSELGLYSY